MVSKEENNDDEVDDDVVLDYKYDNNGKKVNETIGNIKNFNLNPNALEFCENKLLYTSSFDVNHIKDHNQF